MKKKLISVFLFLFILVSVSVPRERIVNIKGNVRYEYDSMDEFYQYWNKAASEYNCVFIWLKPNYTGMNGPWNTYFFGNAQFFYNTTTQCLSATFGKNEITGEIFGGKYFLLPEEYDEAVAFWNSLIKTM